MLDLSEHPKEWQRRINAIKEALPSGTPQVVRLNKAYEEWRKDCSVGSPTQRERVEALYECWLEAVKVIEDRSDRDGNNARANIAINISLASITLTFISLAAGAFFQYSGLKIQEQLLSLNRVRLEFDKQSTAAAKQTNNSLATRPNTAVEKDASPKSAVQWTCPKKVDKSL